MAQIIQHEPVCCPNCYADQWLQDQVRSKSNQNGTCDYCDATNVPVLRIGELHEYFANWFSMYEIDNSGLSASTESLLDKAQLTWGIFADGLAEPAQASLLEDILNCYWDDDNGEFPVDAADFYTFAGGPWHLAEAERWRDFCHDVREDRTRLAIFEDHVLEDIVSATELTLVAGTTIYRARLGLKFVGYEESAYSGTEMGTPPEAKAAAGRANRAGQRVLYCAEEENTAVSEVRPARGMAVSVCQLTLSRPARVLDLVDARYSVNPFASANAAYEVEIADLLDSFTEEMGRPLRRTDDATHYIPCQQLCELFARMGFDGVRYPSALRENGRNVVLFNPGIADVGDSRLVTIESVVVKYE